MTVELACLFCRIIDGSIAAEIVSYDDATVAFRDRSPQAPTHILVVPRFHISNASQLSAENPTLWIALMTMATRVAGLENLIHGYRLVLNTGDDGGQTVEHIHVHVLGNRALAWPPG